MEISEEIERPTTLHHSDTISDFQQFVQLLLEDWTVCQCSEVVTVLAAISNCGTEEYELLEFFFCMLALHIKSIYVDAITAGKGVR